MRTISGFPNPLIESDIYEINLYLFSTLEYQIKLHSKNVKFVIKNLHANNVVTTTQIFPLLLFLFILDLKSSYKKTAINLQF